MRNTQVWYERRGREPLHLAEMGVRFEASAANPVLSRAVYAACLPYDAPRPPGIQLELLNLDFHSGRIVKWWMPDDLVLVDGQSAPPGSMI